MTARTARIDELLRQEIGQALTRDLADPRIGFTTVTEVETTPDLRHAVVWVSVIGQPAERAATVTVLQRAMPHVRHDLGVKLRIKRIPELHIRLDDSMERGTRVLQLIDQLHRGEASDPPAQPAALPTPVARIRREGDADEPEDPPAAGAGEPGSGPRGRGGQSSHSSSSRSGSSHGSPHAGAAGGQRRHRTGKGGGSNASGRHSGKPRRP